MKNPDCQPECTSYEHAPLCPVVRSVEEIAIALIRKGIADALGQLRSESIAAARVLLEYAMSNQPLEIAQRAKARVKQAGADTAKRKAILTCVGCSLTTNPRAAAFDSSIAVRADGFARCNDCEAKVRR